MQKLRDEVIMAYKANAKINTPIHFTAEMEALIEALQRRFERMDRESKTRSSRYDPE